MIGSRQVITFYSFKGGVGRSMTVANVAYRLAFQHGLQVIAVDWDLEAPGLQSFFRVPAKVLKKARGLLDYCEAWETAYQKQATELPDPVSYLMPVEPEVKGDGRGSLRLLLAGKQDEHYDERLGRFDWKRFYAESLGAGAIEHLRNSLAKDADVVLVDSRTGLTDPGGICTIQIPDAVVLMTAPNDASLQGIGRIAQSIATATPEARVGRGTARVFLCMSRVPIIEETYRADKWFAEKKSWFKSGVDAGLWRDQDHRLGLQSHVIPQRGAYGFGESLVGQAVDTLEREPLAQAYDKLTRTLLQWIWEDAWKVQPRPETEVSSSLVESKKALARARKSRNVTNIVNALAERAAALRQAKKRDEALEVIQEAVTLAEKLNEASALAAMHYAHSSILADLEQYAAASDASRKALANAEHTHQPLTIAMTQAQLGCVLVMLGQEQEGARLALKAIADMRAHGHTQEAEQHLARLHGWQVAQGQQREILALKEETTRFIRQRLQASRRLGDLNEEAQAIRDLLQYAEKYRINLPDETQLRQRLEELNERASAAPVKTKRKRASG